MVSSIGRIRILAALTAMVTAIGATAQVCLFTEGPQLDKDDVTLDDFSEPVGTWYDVGGETFPVAAYGDPRINDEGDYEATCASVQHNFVEAEGNDGVTIKGWFVAKADRSEVYHWGYLDTPKDMNTNLDAVVILPALALPKVLAS